MTEPVDLRSLVAGGGFFEAPRWHLGHWWVSDFLRRQVLTVSPDGQQRVVVELDDQPSGLGWLPDGTLLVVSMLDRRVLRVDGRSVDIHADLGAITHAPLNDMLVTSAGTAFVGGFGFEVGVEPPRRGPLVRIEPDGRFELIADDLWFPNGMAIHDGELLVAEYLAGVVTAFAIDRHDTLSARRTFARLLGAVAGDDGPAPASASAPDGIAIDPAGHLWIADPRHRRCVRVASDGEIVDEILVPADLRPYACAIGGPHGRSLLLCCAATHGPTADGTGTLLTTSLGATGA